MLSTNDLSILSYAQRTSHPSFSDFDLPIDELEDTSYQPDEQHVDHTHGRARDEGRLRVSRARR